jgi:hypothetical protein
VGKTGTKLHGTKALGHLSTKSNLACNTYICSPGPDQSQQKIIRNNNNNNNKIPLESRVKRSIEQQDDNILIISLLVKDFFLKKEGSSIALGICSRSCMLKQ